MNMTLLEVDNGRAVFQGISLPQDYNPLGTVHGGWFATLLDAALGCAVQTTLPAGRSYTTAELSMNIVRPASQTLWHGKEAGDPVCNTRRGSRRRPVNPLL
jgi:uncharacterized protein (TIGR00369 family)